MRILWFHPRALFPATGGSDIRTQGLVRLAVNQGHRVCLVQAGSGQPPNIKGLVIVDLELQQGLRRRLAQLIPPGPLRAPRVRRDSLVRTARDIAEFDPQLTIVSEVMTWTFARRLAPSCPSIYDAHNVEHELYQSHFRNGKDMFEKATYWVDRRRITHMERHLMGAAAAVISVSDVDARGLRRVNPRAHITVVPNSITKPTTSADPARSGPIVLFVGTLHYPPNEAAVRDLVDVVMPRVRTSVPDARLLVVGRHPSRATRMLLASAPATELVENPPEVESAYMSARCVAVPMTLGSGTNIKVFEALSYGVPVVATTKAIEGIPIHPGLEVIVEDHQGRFADALATLLTDGEYARDLGDRGRSAFVERLAWETKPAERLAEVFSHVARQAQ